MRPLRTQKAVRSARQLGCVSFTIWHSVVYAAAARCTDGS
jgi:hypothetical protein